MSAPRSSSNLVPERRSVQRSDSPLVHNSDIRSLVEKHANDIRRGIRKRGDNQSGSSASCRDVDIGAMIEQQANLLWIRDRQHQSSRAVGILRVHVGVPVDQHLHGIQRACFGSDHQWSDALRPRLIRADPLIQDCLHLPDVIRANG
jgi:hypothetical protein